MPTEAELEAARAAAKKAEEDAAEEEEEEDDEDPQDEDTEEDEGFLAWIAEQPESVQQEYEEHVKGLKTALTSERRKAKTSSKALKEYTDAEAAQKKAEMTDLEKARAEYSELKTTHSKLEVQLADERLKTAVTTQAGKLDFADPEDAYTLLDLEQVEKGDDGSFKNIEALLKELAKAKPYLISEAGGEGTPRRKQKKQRQKVEGAKPKVRF